MSAPLCMRHLEAGEQICGGPRPGNGVRRVAGCQHLGPAPQHHTRPPHNAPDSRAPATAHTRNEHMIHTQDRKTMQTTCRADCARGKMRGSGACARARVHTVW